MSFTDEDLEILKYDLIRMPDIDVCNYFEDYSYIIALVVRLEAAENCLEKTRGVGANLDEYMAWRKARGL
jgi:hypothetical protein